MAKRLNSLRGWGRLWLVLSFAWVLCVIVIFIGRFPDSREVMGEVGSSYSVKIVNIPLLISRDDLEKRITKRITTERDYANVVEARLENRISQAEFERRSRQLDFQPEVGWSTDSAPPQGKVRISQTPREALFEWLTHLIVSILSAPIIILAVFFSLRWIKAGFVERNDVRD